MTSGLVITAVVLTAVVLYALWERVDRQRESVVRAVVEDLEPLGELTAPSLSPRVDLDACIGSGACVQACPEKIVIGLTAGRARLANPLGCIGHGACEAACPVGAISLVYGTRTRGVELPRLDPHFQTNRDGVYIIGELGGMGLIRNAIEQGRQAAEHVIDGAPDEDGPPRRGRRGAHDAIVVGAGPAGVGATLRMMEAGLDVLLIDREALGGTILHYPRAKVVMTGTLVLPLYGTLRKRIMKKEQLVEVWQDIERKLQPPLVTGELVEGLRLDGDGQWTVVSSAGERRAANVLLALGVRGSPRKLGVAGEEQAKVSYRLLEPAEMDGKHVLVVGGGNSAVETAIALADHGGCSSVTLSYRKGVFARCRGENRERIAQAVDSGQVVARMPSTVEAIGTGDVTLRASESGATERIPNDAVIVQIGGTSPVELLRSFGVEIVTKYGER
ncbi:MAG: NAD(P)-binding domain-containing protein [Myxococcales bacterium]|nr:NAD(P)-binding domain-containing protein [Myxococcales bacterium]